MCLLFEKAIFDLESDDEGMRGVSRKE